MQRRTLLGRLNSIPLALSILVGSGCSHSATQAQGPGAMPPVAVDVTHAAVRDLASYSILDGQIAPSLSSQLSLQQAGTILSVDVQEGDHVVRGQVLAHIDDRVLRAQLAQNEASVSQASAHLQSSNLTTPINGAQVDSELVTSRQQLAQARNALKSAEAASHSAQIIDRSNQRLLAQGYVAQTTYEQNHASAISAQQAVASAQAAVLQSEAALKSSQRNLGQIGVQAQDVVASRGALSQARAQVQLLATQIDQTVLRAPFDGVVTARLLDPGAYAGPNQAILQVAAINPVFVNFDVPDDQLDIAKAGTPVTFSLSGGAHDYKGHVSAVNAVPVNGTLQYRARVIQANPDDTLRGGMLVSVALRRDFVHDALVVPRSAVGRGMDGKMNVFVVSDDHVHAVPVTVGMQTDVLAQISAKDVHAGDTIVQIRPDTLSDGASVKIASTSAVPPSTANPLHQPKTVSSVSQGVSPQ